MNIKLYSSNRKTVKSLNSSKQIHWLAVLSPQLKPKQWDGM